MKSLRQHAHRRLVRRVPRRTGPHRVDRGTLRRQHQFVDFALRRAEAAVDGECARDVGRVAVDLAAGVDQQQIAVAHERVVLDVMQHAGVGACRHDRRVRRRLRALPAELVQELRLDLVLAHARPRAAAWRARVRLAAMSGGRRISASSSASLSSRISSSKRAHVVDLGRRRDARCERARAPAFSQPAMRASQAGSAPKAQKTADWFSSSAGSQLIQFRDRVRLVDAEALARCFGAVAKAVPDLALRILLAAEKQRARGGSPATTTSTASGSRKAGQVVEIAVEPERVMRVAVADALRRRGNHGDPLLHALRKLGYVDSDKLKCSAC